MQGLSLIADEVRKTGKTVHVQPGAISIFKLTDSAVVAKNKKGK